MMSDKNGTMLHLKYGFGSGYRKNLAAGRSISQIISGKRGLFDVNDVAKGDRNADTVFKENKVAQNLPRKGKSQPPDVVNTENNQDIFEALDSSSGFDSDASKSGQQKPQL